MGNAQMFVRKVSFAPRTVFAARLIFISMGEHAFMITPLSCICDKDQPYV